MLRYHRLHLKQKQNHSLYYPLKPDSVFKSVFSIIRDAVLKTKELKAYALNDSTQGFSLTHELTLEQVNGIISKDFLASIAIYCRDTTFHFPNEQSVDVGQAEDCGGVIETWIKFIIYSEHVVKYEIVEDWYIDNKTGKQQVKIAGISPIIEEKDESGEFKGYKNLFWINFQELLPLLLKQQIQTNDPNTTETLADIFQKQKFSSVIIKHSEEIDKRLNISEHGLDGILKSSKIKEEQFNREQDQWEH